MPASNSVSAPSTKSVAVAPLYVTVEPDGPPVSTVTSPGATTTGAVVSFTVTVKMSLPVLPALSVAEQVTMVSPRAKVLPEAGVQFAVIEPSTRSVALAPL